jgi:hypothetical protein
VSLERRVAEEVVALLAMDLEGLRAEWRRLYGPPPKLRSVDLLRRILAWKLQADRFGGIDRELRKALTAKPPRKAKSPRLSNGARISREWQGRRYDVEQTAEGFAHQGKTYGSLSEVAREITGSRWNGPRFFGLRKGGA